MKKPKSNKEKILIELFNDQETDSIIKSFTKSYFQDLKSEVFIVLWQKDEEYITKLHELGKLGGAVRLISRNLLNKVKPDYRNIDPDLLFLFDGVDEGGTEVSDLHERRLEVLNEEIEKLFPFDRVLLKDYIEMGSAKRVSKANKYDYASTTKAINRAKTQLAHLIETRLNN